MSLTLSLTLSYVVVLFGPWPWGYNEYYSHDMYVDIVRLINIHAYKLQHNHECVGYYFKCFSDYNIN